jgi:hypothetical protein
MIERIPHDPGIFTTTFLDFDSCLDLLSLPLAGETPLSPELGGAIYVKFPASWMSRSMIGAPAAMFQAALYALPRITEYEWCLIPKGAIMGMDFSLSGSDRFLIRL